MRPAEHWRTSRMAKIQTTRLPLRTVTAWRLWSGCWGRLVTRTSLTPSQVRGTSQDTQTVYTWRWCTSQRYCTSVEGGFIIKYGISAFFYPPRYAVELVIPRLCENGDCGPCTACPLGRGDGASFRLGARDQWRRSRGGELQAQTSWVGDGPHQHSRLPEVWRDLMIGRTWTEGRFI